MLFILYLFRISEDDIIKLDDRDQTHVLCTGEAGAGKSTLSKRLVSLWARGKMTSPFWNKIKTVIYVAPTDEGDDLTQTMRNAIPGKLEYKDLMMDFYANTPLSVLVVIDGFSEFKNKEVIRKIHQLLKDQLTNVFVTARSNSVELKSQIRELFNSFIEVNGFSDSQSEAHVEKLLKALDVMDSLELVIKMVQNKPKIWKSPFSLSLACDLYVRGVLKPDDIPEKTEISLYSMREHKLVEMELKGQEQCTIEAVAYCELQKIYKLAVYLLVTNKTSCTGDDLKLFKIEHNSPALILLDKEKDFSSKHGHSTRWTWPHSRLHEFDAAMGLASINNFKDSQWIYWIASRPSLNLVAKFLSAILDNDHRHDDVKALTTVTQLLQCKTQSSTVCDSEETVDSYFSNGEFVIQQHAMRIPDTSLVSECPGSPSNGNVSLFQHVPLTQGDPGKENQKPLKKNRKHPPGFSGISEYGDGFQLNESNEVRNATYFSKP